VDGFHERAGADPVDDSGFLRARENECADLFFELSIASAVRSPRRSISDLASDFA